jgi:RES domain-containing protein
LTVYRICTAKHPANDGEGSRINGGRWNHKGTAIIYCAETVSLCALEVLANSAHLPKAMVSIAAEVPDGMLILTIKNSDLPPDWNAPMAPTSTQDIGTKWALNVVSVVLSVPSAVVHQERNLILNPKHPDFAKITFSAPRPFVFDPRLRSRTIL